MFFEKMVDFSNGAGVSPGHHTQNIIFHPVPVEQLHRLHDGGEGASSLYVHPVPVVDLPRPVQRQAHKEVILGKERRPFFRDAKAVGLDGILHGYPGLRMFFFQLHDLPEEVQSGQRRLTALKGKGTASLRRLHGGADDFLHPLGRQHTRKRLLPVLRHIPVEAVGAAHVAGGGRRFDQYIHRRHNNLSFSNSVQNGQSPHPGALPVFL